MQVNYSFFLILVFVTGLSIVSVPDSFAEVEKGVNYDKELISINQDGTYTYKTTLYNYERIEHLGSYQDYVFNDLGSVLEISTAHNKIHLDTSSCVFEFFNKNDQSLFIDSIVGFNSIVDLYDWNEINQLTNAACEAYYDEGNDSLVAKRYASGIGFMEYAYSFNAGKWKTELRVTNLSGLTNRVFGFVQTIDLNRDLINWGGSQKNLDDYHQQTFDRTFLENNDSKVFDFLNNFYFDLDRGFDYLDSVYVEDTGENKSKLVFHYMKNNDILLPDETLMIDPIFGWTADSHDVQTGVATTSPCPTSGYNLTTGLYLYSLKKSTDNQICIHGVPEWDTTPINDYSIIDDVQIRLTTSGIVNPRACDVVEMDNQPTVATAATIWADAGGTTGGGGGTIYVSNPAFCTGIADTYTVDLGTDADTKLQNLLPSDWFAIGFNLQSWSADGVYHQLNTDATGVELQVTYTVPIINIVFDSLNSEIVGDAVKITGSVSISGGPSINQTGIIIFANGSAINNNATITNSTTTPFSVNFGPIWHLMLTDSVYNFTAQVFAQNATTTVSKSSSLFKTWEYDPSYFTAIDPAEGLVNYTFTGTNILQVNRDTNGTLFQVECRYFTQAQAFLNDLESGVWDNQSNVLFYTSDSSGYYYVQCYNSGELFVTAIQQNFSNALVPGLIIFDQLGGFFGAPSIVLVILSILSLGTGRNYPIILLIAASVTGILLALELLTLDPGLVVALIVMAGIGLFGIRKFY